MSVTKLKFQNLATKLVSNTFVDFQKELVFRRFTNAYPGGSWADIDTGTGIDTDIDLKMFNEKSVEVGDIMLVTNVQQWTEVPTIADELRFNGIEYTIVDIKKDPANAAYFFAARKK